MSILQQIFSEQFIHALGWTLVHSLWQGALIGMIVALAMVFLQKFTARLRYFIYSISLFVLVGVAVVTFVSSYSSYDGGDSKVTENVLTRSTVSNIATSTQDISATENAFSAQTILESTAAYCREHFPLFVTIWLLGMLAMMLRFLGGYALVRRYRTHRVKPVMGEWERKFNELAQRIRVKKNVRLFESALVKVPMAIGYLKPIVLLPLGALNGVPAKQMEAILVHELAHIHRRDYLMNLIQSLLEVIFFYHPVVWWLSKNIRIERENICDDIAITITGNTMEFAKALTNIQEINLGSPALAAGLSGKNKNRLVNRIRRLAGKPKIQSGFAEGFIAASILLVSLVGLSAAAMITYPVESGLPEPMYFDESGSTLPGVSYYQEAVFILPPDTTDKKEQARKEEQLQAEKEKQQQMEEMEAIVEAEMKEAEAQLEIMEAELEKVKAMEHYQQAMEEVLSNKEAYMEQMKDAMKAYQEAMKDMDVDFNGSTNWTVPKMYMYDGKTYFGGDSMVWSAYEHPNHYFIHGDSLTEFYFDEWTDQFEDYEELMELKEEELIELQEQWVEFEELHIAEIEPLEFEFEHDFDHDFDYDLNYEFFPGNMGSSTAQRIVSEELHEDGLIDHGREYIILIGNKQMLINGEKQTRAVFKKYRRLIDSMEEPWHFDEDEEIRIHIGH